MKIAICGIATESCTFSPLPTRLQDFRLTRAGDPHFAELYPFLPRFPGARFSGVVSAKAMPGGPVEARAYNAIKSEILDRLTKLLPLDGVYLDMHGAMNVCGMDDAEGEFYAALRALVGPDCLLAASYDLHGNVSERIMGQLDIITGYRTAPHIDTIETRERAVRLLLRCLREGIRPRRAYVRIPVALPGEKTSTEWEPGARVYQAIAGEIDGDRVMDATIQVGYVWADEPRMTACAIAIGRAIDTASDSARRLAQRFWKYRADFRFGVEALSVDDCIQRAMAQKLAPVFISDSGDNPTAGGVGDVTYFLERALALQPPDLVYAAIADADAVKRCLSAGAGAEVKLKIGGKLGMLNARPLPLRGQVQFIRHDDSNPQALLKAGGIRVILTTKRTPFHHRQQFLDVGIVPEAHKIVAVKIGYLVPELKSMARAAYLALSPGAVNQDILSLPFKRITRPCYPFDANMQWTPRVQLF
ncbi:MAG: M81 family metallopeptidase [Chloroflexota bacterium]|nr:M81 family metallopeptidase [Chloroflexota bacterium]MDE2908946.1 M81 family metallopeptidase [Chloroflexota bacterium]